MRAFIALGALAVIAAVSVPFVSADSGASASEQTGRVCPGTFGEYRVHCLAGLEEWDA